jgi:hypothetical protein
MRISNLQTGVRWIERATDESSAQRWGRVIRPGADFRIAFEDASMQRQAGRGASD